MAKSLLLAGILIVSTALSTAPRAELLEAGLSDLADQIAQEMADGNKQKIAVVEFSDLDGRVNELGQFLSEELVTRLFKTKRFTVIERQLLNRVIQEHKLSLSGMVNESAAKQLGQLLGVDAICSGTVSDLVGTVKVNARLISTETGSLFAVAAVEIEKNEVVRKLLGTTSSTVRPQGTVARPADRPGGEFIHEDFSRVPVGLLPTGWIGGDGLIVRSDGGRSFLTDFQDLPVQTVTVPNLQTPANFELTYSVQYGPRHNNTSSILKVGGITTCLDVFGWCTMNQSRSDQRDNYVGKTIQITLIKEGSVFRYLVNGEERIVARYPDYRPATAITLEFRNMSGFRLLSIVGKAL
jgi:TolB-like protein